MKANSAMKVKRCRHAAKDHLSCVCPYIIYIDVLHVLNVHTSKGIALDGTCAVATPPKRHLFLCCGFMTLEKYVQAPVCEHRVTHHLKRYVGHIVITPPISGY